MKISIEIDCNFEEALALVKEGMTEEQANTLLHSAALSVTSRFDFGPDEKTIKELLFALERANFNAIALLAQVVSEEHSLNKDVYRVDYDDISFYEEFNDVEDKVMRRMVGSRIGGIRKITDSINIEPIATIEAGLDGKVVEVKAWAKPIITNYLKTHRKPWVDYINKYLTCDPFDIVE